MLRGGLDSEVEGNTRPPPMSSNGESYRYHIVRLLSLGAVIGQEPPVVRHLRLTVLFRKVGQVRIVFIDQRRLHAHTTISVVGELQDHTNI